MSHDPLRPKKWDEYEGQDKLKSRLQLHIGAAKARGGMLDHLLLVGPPGMGKTSLAALVAQELEVQLASYVMPIKSNTLIKMFSGYHGVFFMDEIHRLSKKDQEMLLPILEDGYVQYDNGAKIPLNGAITFIGATTEPKKLIKPLTDRFTIRPSFEDYSTEQMAKIVTSMARRLGLDPTPEDAEALALASSGVPRQARTLCLAARDVGTTNPKEVLALCGITPNGLTEHHIAYLTALDGLGKVAGIDLISNYLMLPKEIILDTERLLVRRGFVEYTAKGRMLSLAGHKTLQQALHNT